MGELLGFIGFILAAGVLGAFATIGFAEILVHEIEKYEEQEEIKTELMIDKEKEYK